MNAQVTEAHRSLVRAFSPAEYWRTPLENTAAQLIADSEARAVNQRPSWALVESYKNERDQLRAEAEQLRLVNEKRVEAWLNEQLCCDGRECGCMGVTRLEQIIAEGVGQRITALRAEVNELNRQLTVVTAQRGFAKERAEKAEAEVERLTAEDARWREHSNSQVMRVAKAEAELAKLRGFYGEIVAECGHDLIVREYRQRGELLRDEANRRKDAEAELAKERARLDWLSTQGFEHRHHETGDHLAYEWTISSANELKDVSLREVIDAAMKESQP